MVGPSPSGRMVNEVVVRVFLIYDPDGLVLLVLLCFTSLYSCVSILVDSASFDGSYREHQQLVGRIRKRPTVDVRKFLSTGSKKKDEIHSNTN